MISDVLSPSSRTSTVKSSLKPEPVTVTSMVTPGGAVAGLTELTFTLPPPFAN